MEGEEVVHTEKDASENGLTTRRDEDEIRRLLRVRKAQQRKRPNFARQESWRYKRVSVSWRRPRGIDSKMRVKKGGYPKSVQVGYRSPKLVRGLHPSGFEEVLVYNANDLEKVNSKQVVRVGRTVGFRKRLLILEKARELNLHILNPKGVDKTEYEDSEATSL